jgi:hypothetical protein
MRKLMALMIVAGLVAVAKAAGPDVARYLKMRSM